MNFLNIRKGPPMEFVVGEHRNDFEQLVIELYMFGAQTGSGFWGAVPSLEEHVIKHLPAKYIIAGLLGEVNNDPSYFIKETYGADPDFLRLWCEAQMTRITVDSPDSAAYGLLKTRKDAFSVIEYHRMSCMVLMGDAPGTGIQGFANCPLTSVW